MDERPAQIQCAIILSYSQVFFQKEQGFNEVEVCMDEELSGKEFVFMVLLNRKHGISMGVSKCEK